MTAALRKAEILFKEGKITKEDYERVKAQALEAGDFSPNSLANMSEMDFGTALSADPQRLQMALGKPV